MEVVLSEEEWEGGLLLCAGVMEGLVRGHKACPRVRLWIVLGRKINNGGVAVKIRYCT